MVNAPVARFVQQKVRQALLPIDVVFGRLERHARRPCVAKVRLEHELSHLPPLARTAAHLRGRAATRVLAVWTTERCGQMV